MLFSQKTCTKAAQQEPFCAAYNFRSSGCAFVDEALLWHADCAGATFQKLYCSCTPHAVKALRLYAALYMPFLSPPELHEAIAVGCCAACD